MDRRGRLRGDASVKLGKDCTQATGQKHVRVGLSLWCGTIWAREGIIYANLAQRSELLEQDS